MSVLETIHGHDDLVRLSPARRDTLCTEIREFLVSHLAKTGGHLASNLGVVELSVALETVFDTQYDRLVFDVGHQSYVHKLLTGRQADFARLRQFGGIAGFPKPSESCTDAFVAGHASSSVSISLGMARARTLMKEDYHVVTVLGDGAATGGMVYEGLNDAAESREPMIVILNDNEMSIDRNVGGMARHLSRLRSKEGYLGAKAQYRDFMRKIPGGQAVYDVTRHMKDWVKRSLIPTTIFENMGFTYLGPVDGHDLTELISLLRIARDMKCPVLLHVLTQKGKGYAPAERNPSKFHGIGKFDPISGDAAQSSKKSFSQVFGETMLELANEDSRVCAITAAMPGGTGLLDFKNKFPKRLFDVGIAEEHAVSMAGGLAKQGMIPVVAIYSTFLQRSYDQILQDAAMLNLHMVFAVDRAGLVGEDGETHHGVFDVGFLRHAPGMTILAPASCAELSDMLRWAVLECSGPVAVRYPRGGDGLIRESHWDSEVSVVCHRTGRDCAIITYGTLVDQAIAAADQLAEVGIHASVLRLTKITPMSMDSLENALAGIPYVLIMEEAAAGAGIADIMIAKLHSRLPGTVLTSVDLGGEYVTHGSVQELYKKHGLDAESVSRKIKEDISNEN